MMNDNTTWQSASPQENRLENSNGHAKFKRYSAQVVIITILAILLFLQFFPLWIVLVNSFKVPSQYWADPYGLSFPLTFANYPLAWAYVKDLFLNTVILAIANVVGTIGISSITAFAFVRFRFPGKELIFTLILSVMMIPGTLTLVAQFMLADVLNLLGSRWGVILPQVAGNTAFNVFLLRTFFRGVPNDIFEAAEIDGASDLRMFLTLMIPLSGAIIATAAIMLVMQSWNDLIWPKLVLREEQYTITTGLLPFTDAYYNSPAHSYSAPMAGYVITSIPLIFMFFIASKQFIKGLTSGAFKM